MSWTWKEPTGTTHVAEFVAHFFGFEAELLLLGWAVLVALHVYAIVQLMQRRRRREAAAADSQRPKTEHQRGVLPVPSQPETASAVARGTAAATQIERLFGILDTSAASVERAMSAHLAAAKHLDSAEYQLLKLFDEFPMLVANRNLPKRTANLAVVTPVAQAAQAMAA